MLPAMMLSVSAQVSGLYRSVREYHFDLKKTRWEDSKLAWEAILGARAPRASCHLPRRLSLSLRTRNPSDLDKTLYKQQT